MSSSRYIGTISRELIRNGGISNYDPGKAQKLTEHRRKTALKSIRFTEEMKELIIQPLRKEWSLEQIHGRCKTDNIDMVRQLADERIYQFIWDDKENGGDLYKHLRNSHKKKKKNTIMPRIIEEEFLIEYLLMLIQ